jgi:hypothetical protein
LLKKSSRRASWSFFRLDNQIRNKLYRLVQIRHSQHWLIFAIDPLLKASDSSASATRVPQVADPEEETHHKVETGQPRTRRSEVKRVNFSCDFALASGVHFKLSENSESGMAYWAIDCKPSFVCF